MNTDDIHVLVTVHKGIVDEVRLFEDEYDANRALEEVSANRNLDDDDVALFSVPVKPPEHLNPIYLVCNPQSNLGFAVADEGYGFEKPEDALYHLGSLRKEYGSHLKLFRVVKVKSAVTTREKLENLVKDTEDEDFDYELVKEYLS